MDGVVRIQSGWLICNLRLYLEKSVKLQLFILSSKLQSEVDSANPAIYIRASLVYHLFILICCQQL